MITSFGSSHMDNTHREKIQTFMMAGVGIHKTAAKKFGFYFGFDFSLNPIF
jgi:hypothetical protein